MHLSYISCFKNETFEIASKNRFIDDSVQLNLSAYVYDYKNYPFFQPVFTNNVDAGAIQDFVDIETYGVGFYLIYQATDNDRFTITSAYAVSDHSGVRSPYSSQI